MTRCSAASRGIWFVLALLLAGGCMPPPGAGNETQAERYLSAGRTRVERKDFAGAVAAFEQALQSDPRLSRAHHDLAVLFDTQLNAPEKALYHYVRVLELQPDHQWADLISNRLGVVKMQLARSSLPAIPSPQLAREIDRLENELGALKTEHQRVLAENDELRRRVALLTPQNARPAPQLVNNEVRPAPDEGVVTQAEPTDGSLRPLGQSASPASATVQDTARFQHYQIQRGDSLYGTARRHRVSMDEIIAANPGLSAGNFPAGKTIRIPVK